MLFTTIICTIDHSVCPKDIILPFISALSDKEGVQLICQTGEHPMDFITANSRVSELCPAPKATLALDGTSCPNCGSPHYDDAPKTGAVL